MKIAKKSVLTMLYVAGLIVAFILIMQPLAILFFGSNHIAVLFPKGIVALKERGLLFIIQALMLIIIIPVYALTFIFSWKYSAQNPKGVYEPDLADNRLAEYIWWGVPLVMTLFVCALSFFKTHELDPYKPLVSDVKPLKIQVVALQWKWLFLYPEEKIASVNFLQFPKETPLDFEITADAPMNSFWLPDLGGQIYAMPTMQTKLHLISHEEGDFRGSSANISGEGFSGMNFIARSSTKEAYQKWVEEAKSSTKALSWKEYAELAAPSLENPVALYELTEGDLFSRILNKYSLPKKD